MEQTARGNAASRGGAKNNKVSSGFSLFNVKVGGVDLTFLVLVLLLLTIGLIMLFSASYAYCYYYFKGDSLFYISRQVLWAVVGVVLMILISTVDYKILNKLAWPLMLVAFALLVVVLFFPHDGARRWIDFGFTTFQPSELAKLAVVIVFAHMATMLQDRMNTFRYGILPFSVILAVVVVLMMLEPHLSGTLLILGIGAVMMIAGGSNLKWFGTAVVVGIVLLGIIVMIPGVIGYAEHRFAAWIDPFSDPQDTGFQIIQSLYAIGSGGLMGVGIGNSRQKYLYLPEPQNDFIFSVVCEELGFVGATLIIILFALLIWRGFVIAMRCRDRFGSLVAVGLTAQVGMQTILNIMVVTNTIPNTGISLPFFSYGGTALVMLLCQMGVVLSISRESTMEKL